MLLKFDLRKEGLVRDRIVRTSGSRPLDSFARELFLDRPEIDEIWISRGRTVVGVFSRAAAFATPRAVVGDLLGRSAGFRMG